MSAASLLNSLGTFEGVMTPCIASLSSNVNMCLLTTNSLGSTQPRILFSSDGIQKEVAKTIAKEQMGMLRMKRSCWETSSLEESGSSSRLYSCHTYSWCAAS